MKTKTKQTTRKRALADRADRYARSQTVDRLTRNRGYVEVRYSHPEKEAARRAYEDGYRAALSDLRRAIRTSVPGPGSGKSLHEAKAQLIETVHAFLRPMK